jgi:hypothetical protein
MVVITLKIYFTLLSLLLTYGAMASDPETNSLRWGDMPFDLPVYSEGRSDSQDEECSEQDEGGAERSQESSDEQSVENVGGAYRTDLLRGSHNSTSRSYSPTLTAGWAPELQEVYIRLVESCKNGLFTTQFLDDIDSHSEYINLNPVSKRTYRCNNHTLLYHVISNSKRGARLPEIFSNIKQRIRMIEVLIEKGADLSILFNHDNNGHGDNLLHLACYKSHVRIVSLLLDYEIPPLLKGCDGWTALHYAARNVGHSLEVVELLLGQDVAVNALDQNRCTPLDRAMFLKGSLGIDESIALLTENGAVSGKDSEELSGEK